jgi:hypothetical protein
MVAPMPMKKALHDKAKGALFGIELVGNKGPEWLHTNVDAGIENPE